MCIFSRFSDTPGNLLAWNAEYVEYCETLGGLREHLILGNVSGEMAEVFRFAINQIEEHLASLRHRFSRANV